MKRLEEIKKMFDEMGIKEQDYSEPKKLEEILTPRQPVEQIFIVNQNFTEVKKELKNAELARHK